MTHFPHVPVHVVVAGGGVAAAETCLALRALAGDRVVITLVAPAPYLVYRPADIRDPLAVRHLARVPLARLAEAAGADLRRDRVVAVDGDRRLVFTAAGYELSYDALVLAVGAGSGTVPPGAVAFDEDHLSRCRGLVRDVASVAFVVPPAPTRAFDLYDLAFETALRGRATISLVTAEPAPLAVLGMRASATLRGALRAQGVRVVESAHVRSVADGVVELAPPSRRIVADAVIAAPRLAGPALGHLPCDRDGFLRVEAHGRVVDSDRVFAAGDCTAFPVKHPSLAAEQADAVAATIAACAGAPVTPERFTPVLRGILPARPARYVEAPLTGGQGDEATRISATAPWSSGLRFGARFLAPSLEGDRLTTELVRSGAG
jgi:sulfide:quinone oxidoreductase